MVNTASATETRGRATPKAKTPATRTHTKESGQVLAKVTLLQGNHKMCTIDALPNVFDDPEMVIYYIKNKDVKGHGYAPTWRL